jgi:hypothetical protein
VATKMPAPVNELGYATAYSSSWWLSAEQEQTPELRWPLSIGVYDRMRRQDAQAASVLRAVTLPVRQTRWSIDQAGASDEVAQFVVRQPRPARRRGGAPAGDADAGPVLLVEHLARRC